MSTQYIRSSAQIATNIAAPGSTGQIPYNNGGIFAASANLVFDGTTLAIRDGSQGNQGALLVSSNTTGGCTWTPTQGNNGMSWDPVQGALTVGLAAVLSGQTGFNPPLIQLGDYGGSFNATLLTVDDNAQTIALNAGNGISISGSNLSMTGRAITNVTDPSNPQDAATKNYVDTISLRGAKATLKYYSVGNDLGGAGTTNASWPTITTWDTRVLNAKTDPFSLITSLTSNVFTVTHAGTYHIDVVAPYGTHVGGCITWLYDITNATGMKDTNGNYVQSAAYDTATNISWNNFISADFVATAGQQFSIQSAIQTHQSNFDYGEGQQVNGTDVFTQVVLTFIKS